MTPDEFIRTGEAIFGPRWVVEMSRLVGVSRKTIQRYHSAEARIPDDLGETIAKALQAEARRLSDLAGMIRNGDI